MSHRQLCGKVFLWCNVTSRQRAVGRGVTAVVSAPPAVFTCSSSGRIHCRLFVDSVHHRAEPTAFQKYRFKVVDKQCSAHVIKVLALSTLALIMSTLDLLGKPGL